MRGVLLALLLLSVAAVTPPSRGVAAVVSRPGGVQAPGQKHPPAPDNGATPLKGRGSKNAHTAQVQLDTARVQVRVVPPAKIDRYRRDPDYRYTQATEGTDWRGRLNRWIAEHILEPIFEGVTSKAFTWLLRIAAALFLVWVVMKALKIQSRAAPLAAPEANNVRFEEVSDVRSVDFDALIDAAAGRGDYRQAIRYCYLKTIQVLQANGFLKWRPGKTNREYMAEVRQHAPTDVAIEFAHLTHTFEYVWYGAFTVGAPALETARRHLNAFAAMAGRDSS